MPKDNSQATAYWVIDVDGMPEGDWTDQDYFDAAQKAMNDVTRPGTTANCFTISPNGDAEDRFVDLTEKMTWLESVRLALQLAPAFPCDAGTDKSFPIHLDSIEDVMDQLRGFIKNESTHGFDHHETQQSFAELKESLSSYSLIPDAD